MEPAVNTLIDTSTGKAIDLAMQSLEVTGRVYPVGSFVRVIHRFRCLGTRPMEAIYVSQLPTNGVLRRFKVIGENFESDSKLEKRKKARETYEEGVAGGHLSVLAETNQDGMVSLTVGQVQPDEEISVIMDVVVGVDIKDKGFRFRYPFTLAPNYHPQAKATATEAGGTIELPSDVFGDLVLPEWKASGFGLHEVTFNLLVFGGGDLVTCSSPSHRITVSPQGDGSHKVSLAGMADTPNRDLVIDVSVPEAKPLLFADATLLGATPTGNEPVVPADAARWTALVPSSALPKTTRQPRKVCFLLDRSGSMTGGYNHDPTAPILGAKKALLACLSLLQSDDEFGIVHFGSDATKFDNRMGKADDVNRARAAKWVEAIQCAGGTEMLTALSAATQVLGGPGGDIFLITDGEVYGTGAIVEQMSASGSRVHVLGIGTAAQHRFMAQLARRTGGVADMVSPSENVAATGLKLFGKVREPVLTDTTAKVDGVDVKNVGTVWGGLPVLINDPRGDGSLPGTILLNGTGLKKAKAVKKFAKIELPDGLVSLLWAGRRIEDLSSKLDMAGQGPMKDRIEQKMEDVSVGYSLASRVMSLVAVVERIGDQAGITPDQTVVPVGVPEGQAVQGVFAAQVNHASILGQAGVGMGNTGMLRSMTLSSPVRSRRDYSSVGVRSFAPQTRRRAGEIIPESSKGQPISVNYSATMSLDSDLGPTKGMTFDSMDLERERGLVLNDSVRGVGFGDEVADLGEYIGTTQPAMPVAAVCGAFASEPYDDGQFRPHNDLMTSLTGLLADGGVRGNTLEERVLHTLLLLLLVSLEAAKVPGVYDAHIVRLVEFLTANKRAVSGRASLVHKGIKAGVAGSARLSEQATIGLFDKPTAVAWEAIRLVV
jgi:Ca-activated chloride channel family protein